MTQKIYRLDKTRPVFEQETFSTKQEVIDACFNADPSDPVYRDFAAVVGLDEATIATGSIVTTAYNKDLLRRRVEAREGQLRFFSPAIAGPKELGLKYSISPALHMAFTKASSTHDPSLPFRVTVISNTRETLFFDLAKEFPDLMISMTCASPTQENADDLNRLVHTYAPGMAALYPYLEERLYCTPNWYKTPAKVAHCNSALIYQDVPKMQETVDKIKAIEAQYAVFNNLFPSKDPNGETQWIAQRYEGGIIPLHRPKHGTLVEMMSNAGYAPLLETGALATYDASEDVKQQMGKLDHLVFERAV